MKVTYTADDGTEFDSADECLAYEEDSSDLFQKWNDLIHGSELSRFLFAREVDMCDFWEREDWWTYRRRFIALAKSFIEVDPTLKQLID